MKVAGAIIVGIAVLLIGGFAIFNQYIYNQKQAQPPAPNDQTSMASLVDLTPIEHASFILNANGQTIYNDPVGADLFAGKNPPNIILISDIHGDHMDADTLKAVSNPSTIIILPQAVADQLPDGIPGTQVVMKNGDKTTQNGVNIEAVASYNYPETADARHTKGRGNGYIVEADGKRVYIAGDTGPTPEMKALQNIDVAFVPMNLPYTMGVEDAATAVLAFKPKVVHPYHFRGPDGLADTAKFKELVEAGDPSIKVELLNFYPTQ